jgi:D-glycero-alpha-D-manno-heptose-7-phosphate kinase
MIRCKAPLRLGLAGGGTDVSPYADLYGGAILNASINLYAYAHIQPLTDGSIHFESIDRSERCSFKNAAEIELNGYLDLLKGVSLYIEKYIGKPLSFLLSTYVDAPAGSGLGTSSTLVVAILGAFKEWLNLPWGEYDMARIAYEIERKELKMAGGRQDQYAATFGGVNFMEFYADEKVIVNPLRIRTKHLDELQNNLLLYYTGTSRLSAAIIDAQQKNVVAKSEKSIDAMHQLKAQSSMMKEALLRGQLNNIGEILDFGWQHKKQMASEITNPLIDELYSTALKNGATGGKISGAGGGGFMLFYCPENTRFQVMKALQSFGGEFRRYEFTEQGVRSWTSGING